MITIKFDHGTIEAGGSVFHIHNNIRDRVTYKCSMYGVVNITIDGYDVDHEFDVSLQGNLSLDCVVIKLDDDNKVSVEKMSEQSFMSRKHLQ